MDLVSTVNPPRIVWLGGQTYWVRAISIEGMAILLGWLDDVIAGRAERKMPPEFSSPEAQAALTSPTGHAVLTWIALREHGVTFDQAGHLSDRLSDLERVRLLDVLFSKRRTAEVDPNESAEDIAKTWCGKGLAQFARERGISELARYSTDQLEWLLREGEIDVNPRFGSEELEKRQASWEVDELPKILAMVAEQKGEAI